MPTALCCRAYNPDSSDTDGLVDSTWVTINWVAVGYLFDNYGLQPWYKLAQ